LVGVGLVNSGEPMGKVLVLSLLIAVALITRARRWVRGLSSRFWLGWV
jgi:hypothetical protein